jgi:hypothetical protein
MWPSLVELIKKATIERASQRPRSGDQPLPRGVHQGGPAHRGAIMVAAARLDARFVGLDGELAHPEGVREVGNHEDWPLLDRVRVRVGRRWPGLSRYGVGQRRHKRRQLLAQRVRPDEVGAVTGREYAGPSAARSASTTSARDATLS